MTAAQRVGGIVLCGGRSTRMGRDKGALPFGAETMLARVTRIVSQVAGPVIVAGRRDQDHATVHDAIEDQGPLAGLAAALAASAADLNVVVACDMPLVRPEVLRRLIGLIGDHDACVAMVDGHASALCGVYRSRIAAEAQRLVDAGERRMMRLLEQVQTRRIDADDLRDIDPGLDTFISCDTPEAYALALDRIGAS